MESETMDSAEEKGKYLRKWDPLGLEEWIFFKIKKITCMLNVCAFVHMAACACGGRKRAQYLLELELHGVMSCLR